MEMHATTRRVVRARSDVAEGLTPMLSLELAVLSSSIVLQSQVKNVLEHFFGAQVLESVIEHQPLDDPTAEAERVEPPVCVVVERLCVRERADRHCA
jgi:hypothetical protein